MSSKPKTLRDVTDEVVPVLPEKYVNTFDYLVEQIKSFEEQLKEIDRARQLTVAMLQDVVRRGGKDLSLEIDKWTFDMDKKRYVPVEEKKGE